MCVVWVCWPLEAIWWALDGRGTDGIGWLALLSKTINVGARTDGDGSSQTERKEGENEGEWKEGKDALIDIAITAREHVAHGYFLTKEGIDGL